MDTSVLAGLIACNIIWSVAYALSKALMREGFHSLEVSFLREATAFLGMLLYCLMAKQRRRELFNWPQNLKRVDWRIVLVGVLTFAMSPFCQMYGLELSRAIDGSLMIALEPLVTITFAFVFLKEKLGRYQLVAVLLALLGAGVLTELTWEKVKTLSDSRLIGNMVFLLSLMSEAAYSIVSKPALKQRTPPIFLTGALGVGTMVLFLANIILVSPSRLGGLTPLINTPQWNHIGSFLFLGLGCTLIGYLYWMTVLQRVSVSIMALTLYVQPILGMIWGNIFLGETIFATTWIGAALILAAVWLGGLRHKEGG